MNALPFSIFRSLAFMTLAAMLLYPNLAPAANPHETNLNSFEGSFKDGSVPLGGLVADAAGNFYGTTSAGGNFSWGTVFELSPQSNGSWIETVLYNFTGGNDGAIPTGSLIFDKLGNLYGTTSSGGFQGNDCNVGGGGVAFELSPGASGSPWTETTLHAFKCSTGNDGANPVGALVFDTKGNLYGTTIIGGASNVGTVFELSPASNSWTENILHSFSGNDGLSPHAGLIIDSTGALFGTTFRGGDTNSGVIFRLRVEQAGWILRVLFSFHGPDGAAPNSALILHNNILYGTTETGGFYDEGEVFQALKGSITVTVVYSFLGGADGTSPNGVVADPSGYLYGTTNSGGSGRFAGTLYQLKPSSQQGDPWTKTVLHKFQADKDGGYPAGNLIISQGALWGTTSQGGLEGSCHVNGCGVSFRFGY